jgi:raffinose/stachyose/melibiose transport system substrate-binding protein
MKLRYRRGGEMADGVPSSDLLAQIAWSRRTFLKRLAQTSLAVGSLGGATALLAACQPGGGASGAASAGASAAATASAAASSAAGPVDFWTFRQPDVDLFNSIIAEIKGPQLKPTMAPATEFDAKVLTAMQADQGPDLFRGRAGVGFYGPYAKAQQLVALNDAIPDLETNFPQSALDATSVDGQVYAVPANIDVTHFIFNKKVVGDLGPDGPATWGELIDLGRSLKKSGMPFIVLAAKDAWPLQFIVAGIAATDLTDDYVSNLLAGKAKFSDAPFVEVLQKLKDLTELAQPGYQAGTYDDLMTSISSGKAAGTMFGAWIPGDLKKTNPDLELYQFLAPPNQAGGQRQAAYFYDGTWAVNARAKNPAGALALARASATPRFGQLMTDQQGIIAAMAPNTHPTVKDPNLARTLELAQHLTPRTWWQFSAFDAGNPSINSLLPPAAQAVVTGQLTPQQAAEQIQKGLASWYTFS